MLHLKLQRATIAFLEGMKLQRLHRWQTLISGSWPEAGSGRSNIHSDVETLMKLDQNAAVCEFSRADQ